MGFRTILSEKTKLAIKISPAFLLWLEIFFSTCYDRLPVGWGIHTTVTLDFSPPIPYNFNIKNI